MVEHLSVSMLMALILAPPLVGQGVDPKLAAGVDTTKALPLPPLVVTVSKVPLRADRAGFQVSVVSALDLEVKRPLYIADALRGLPGSYIDEAAGPGGADYRPAQGRRGSFHADPHGWCTDQSERRLLRLPGIHTQ